MLFPTLDDYNIFLIPKKRTHKEFRQIESPKNYLRKKQKKHIKEILLHELSFSKYAHGFVKGRSIITNAIPHIGKKYILKLDIKEFFASTTWQMFENNYKKIIINYNDERLNSYKIHFLYDNDKIRLPQGGLASPFIANFTLFIFDYSIAKIFHSFDDKNIYQISYTRYADDITISSNNLKILKKFIKIVKKVLNSFGYDINDKKTVIIPYWKQQRVCGIVVNSKLNLDKKFRKKIRAIKFQLDHGKIIEDNRIKGLLSYYNMVMKNKRISECS